MILSRPREMLLNFDARGSKDDFKLAATDAPQIGCSRNRMILSWQRWMLLKSDAEGNRIILSWQRRILLEADARGTGSSKAGSNGCLMKSRMLEGRGTG